MNALRPNRLYPKVAAMLHTSRIRRATTGGHSVFCFETPTGVLIQLCLRDDDDNVVDLVSIEPNENGFVHPAQVVYEIMKVWDVAIDHTKWKLKTPSKI